MHGLVVIEVMSLSGHLSNINEIPMYGFIYFLFVSFRYTWQTYSKVFSRVDNVAFGLYSIGLKPLDKIIIYADTCAEWLITALACFKSSITIVTLYTNLGDDGIIYGINQVQVEVMVTRY